MFREKLAEIVTRLESLNPVFQDRAFCYDDRTVGGFKGITSEFQYFIYGRFLDDSTERFQVEESDLGGKIIDAEFTFSIVAQTLKYSDKVLTILYSHLLTIPGVHIEFISDDTESIYQRETGEALPNSDFQLYGFYGTWRGKIDVQKKAICIGEPCISLNDCI